MKGHNTNPLDRLLRHWAEQQSLPDADVDRLRSRIVESLEDAAPTESLAADPAIKSKAHQVAAFSVSAFAAAALVMLSVSLLWQPSHEDNVPKITQDELLPDSAKLTENRIREKELLLKEVESLFAGQSVWLLESGGDVQVGVANHEAQRDAKPLTVRVVVERRSTNQGNWSEVWSADIVTRSEEVVRLEPNSALDAEMAMWAYVLPEGMISVDVELTLHESIEVNLFTSSVLKNGEPLQVSTTQANEYEYRLFQTAAVLDDPVI